MYMERYYMRNITFKLTSVLMIFMGMTYCSPNLDEDDYLRAMTGGYTLTETGVGFIRRELAGHVSDPIAEGTELEMRGDGSLNIIFPAVPPTLAKEQKIAQFIRLELEDQGLYLLEGPNTYVAMGKSDAAPPLLISTTNGENSENNVFFEHLVPIAFEKADE